MGLMDIKEESDDACNHDPNDNDVGERDARNCLIIADTEMIL